MDFDHLPEAIKSDFRFADERKNILIRKKSQIS